MTASIVVFGTESTGKTTLAEALALRLACPWSSEYVRDYWYTHDGDIQARDLTHIAAGQLERMSAARAAAVHGRNPYVIHDTDLLTHVLWADLLFPRQCADWVRETAEIQAKHAALYLLCDIDIAWANDPQRCFSDADERAAVQACFKQTLIERDLSFVTLQGKPKQRLTRALAAIETLVPRPTS